MAICFTAALRQLAFATLASTLGGESLQSGGQRDLDLAEIAEIVRAYQNSIESMEIRTVSRFFPVEKYATKFPGAQGPNVSDRLEFAFAPGDLAYYRERREKDGQLIRAKDWYKTAGVAYEVEYADVDPSQVITVTISRNYRGELIEAPPPDEITAGLLLVDGSPLHELLAAPETKLTGRKKIRDAVCYEVRGVVRSRMRTPLQTVYYLDPNRDFLCRELEFRDEEGNLRKAWQTTEFMHVGSRWFPKKVIRAATQPVDGKAVITTHRHTEVEEVRINQAMDPKLFIPNIPDGAWVEDTRGDGPVSYFQGGEAAGKRLQQRLNALRSEAKTTSPIPTGKRIVVSRGPPWVILIASTIAVSSGAVLIVAFWLRRTRG